MPKKKYEKENDFVAPTPQVVSEKELKDEITSLKSQISGYKSTIATRESKIATLEKAIARYKVLDKEADELNEQKIAELDKKDGIIRTLQTQINELKKRNDSVVEKYREITDELNVCKQKFNTFVSLPWYKRLFYKV